VDFVDVNQWFLTSYHCNFLYMTTVLYLCVIVPLVCHLASSFGHHNNPHYGSCPSLCLSICLSVCYRFVTKQVSPAVPVVVLTFKVIQGLRHFLLVINNNLGIISLRFPDMASFPFKKCLFYFENVLFALYHWNVACLGLRQGLIICLKSFFISSNS